MKTQSKKDELKFYNSRRSTNEYPLSRYLKWVKLFVTKLKISKESIILDLGCGSGPMLKVLFQLGFKNLIGLDLSHNLLLSAKKDLNKKIFVRGDIDALPFKDSSCENIVLLGVLHHLCDCKNACSEIYRVLVNGGKLFSLDPNLICPYFLLKRKILRKYYKKWLSENESAIMPFYISSLFKRIGFSKIQYFGLDFIPIPITWSQKHPIVYKIEKLLENSPLHFFAGHIAFIAEK